jgi:hypothetical protein
MLTSQLKNYKPEAIPFNPNCSILFSNVPERIIFEEEKKNVQVPKL